MSVIQTAICRIVSLNNNCHILLAKRFTTSTLNTSKITVEEKLGITRRPKRPLNAFLSYAMDRRLIVAQQNPQAKPKDLMKLLSVEWKNLDQTKKDQFQETFKKNWLKYLEETKKYDEMLSPGEKEKIQMMKDEAKIFEAKKYIKKKREELGCPKKPGSSYIYYLKAKLPERGEALYSDFQKKLKKDWDSLPLLEKQRFEEMYRKDMENYREKLSEWNRKMLEKGNKDVDCQQPLPSKCSFEVETVIPSITTESKINPKNDEKIAVNQYTSTNNQLQNKQIIYVSLISTSLAVIFLMYYIIFY